MTEGLSEDIYYGICEQLFHKEDFNTLFNCAVSSKRLAPLACAHLYKIYSQSSVNDEEAEAFQGAQQVQRWSIMWRSIILSALDGTILPYYRYLRYLNLRDFHNLLEDSRFRAEIEDSFFAGPLSEMKHTITRPGLRSGQHRTWLDFKAIVSHVGDTIAPRALLLEALSGTLASKPLLRWIPGLTRLQRLELFDGSVLEDEEVRNAVAQHCPHFKALSIYQWFSASADTSLASLLSKLAPDSLETLITISRCGVGAESCASLNSHKGSLRELRLTFEASSVPAMSLLSEIRSLERLILEIPFSTDLKATQNDVYVTVTAWLSQCTRLREVTLHEFLSGPDMLTPLLLNPDARLEEIELNARGSSALYSVKDSRAFHRALVGQRATLRDLSLKGHSEEAVRDDLEALVDSVSQLTGLRRLQLLGVSDYFTDEQILQILGSLRDLEEVYVGGYGVSDAVLESAAELRNLRTVTFNAVTAFTAEGLLSFIGRLRPSNYGILIAVDNADPEKLIPEERLETIRATLREKAHGRLDYIPFRDPDASEFEGESD